jgi:hypothetical protein
LFAILVALCGAALFVAGPASSAPITGHLTTNGSNGTVQGACSFTVTSVNYSAGTVDAQMGGQAQPANLLAAIQIAHNRIVCWLYSPGGVLLATIVGDFDSSDVGTFIRNVNVPQLSSYVLCGQAQATLRSGSQSTTSVFCHSGAG